MHPCMDVDIITCIVLSGHSNNLSTVHHVSIDMDVAVSIIIHRRLIKQSIAMMCRPRCDAPKQIKPHCGCEHGRIRHARQHDNVQINLRSCKHASTPSALHVQTYYPCDAISNHSSSLARQTITMTCHPRCRPQRIKPHCGREHG